MTYVTKLRLESGQREALDEVVTGLKETVERKGGECKGPHASPSASVRVSLYDRVDASEPYGAWEQPVYERRLEIYGNERIVGELTNRSFPDGIHVEIEIDQHQPAGHRR
ncbi:MAG: uS10/mL48 family ribosomal protein [Haloquadratum sp.]|jgi:ribosomal protein S10|nr:uS10/mL48 family ribosomal protein [Haloferacaceae archaeon]MDR9444956.1 uS10/mL48 family ribosomal protein [Haloquadratum sp.]